MMFKYLITLLVVSATCSDLSGQQKITWETLSDVKFKKKISEEDGLTYLFPVFGAKLKTINNAIVSIQGFMIPVDPDEDLYVLSANPYSSCFFCGQAGPETVIEVHFKSKPKRLKMDQFVTLQGVLKLNEKDIEHCNYILENAEIIVQSK